MVSVKGSRSSGFEERASGLECILGVRISAAQLEFTNNQEQLILMNKILRLHLLLPVFLLPLNCSQAQEEVVPEERQRDILAVDALTLPAPIKRWDNAIPLGNGSTGGLLWGEGNTLRLSLDRGDLWDERGNADVYSDERTFDSLVDSIDKRDRRTWRKCFDDTYHSQWTKIPGGRLEITLPTGLESKSFHLEFDKATARVDFSDGSIAEAVFSAAEPVAVLRLPKGASFELIRPESINQLGYFEPVFSKQPNEVSYSQQTAEDLSYAVSVNWQDTVNFTLVAIAICSSNQNENPLQLARQQNENALAKGWDNLHQSHLAWWKEFYRSSEVTIPEPRLQHHYNLVKYFYGSASRAHASPMPLQGIWTSDSGGLPPWKGDYHNDLNTQMTYVAWHAAGLTDPGMAYLNFYWDRLPQFRKYAKDFFDIEGAMVPGVMTHRGQAMGGWPQYAMSLTVGLWNGHAFYQHWKTSGDDKFLADRAYPWLKEVASSVFSLAEEKDGDFQLPLSSSPEWNDNRWEAYLKPNSNFDQALLLWSAGALEEMALALGKTTEAKDWSDIRSKLAPLKFDSKNDSLLISEGIPFDHSHRHFSHTMAIHPLGILNIEQSAEAKAQVQASVRQLIDHDSHQWVGYSFTWAASLAARAGFAEDCRRLLTDFERAFVTRNGFHVNGDQTKTGLSGFQYRPFTLEGNFLFMDAIQEMYLQSWGGRIRVFPTVPAAWKDCRFDNLRGEGGLTVSADRIDGMMNSVKIVASKDGEVTVRDPFDGNGIWNKKVLRQSSEWITFQLLAKETLQGKRG